jgi:hypothetical protein
VLFITSGGEALFEEQQQRRRLQMVTAQVLYHKPSDPKQFIIDLLLDLQSHGAKPLLDKSDVNAIFGMFDVTHRGLLTKQQAFRAVKTVLGPQHKVVQALGDDANDDQTMMAREHFVEYVSGALVEAMPKIAS